MLQIRNTQLRNTRATSKILHLFGAYPLRPVVTVPCYSAGCGTSGASNSSSAFW